jgi:outer membrane protein TolC
MTLIPFSHGCCSLFDSFDWHCFLILGTSLPVLAQSLSDLLAIALKDEATYQGTIAELRAAQARNRQMIGAFLPQITASVNTNANQRGYLTRNLNVLEQKDGYNSHSWQVNLSQPLWRYSAIADKE